MTPTGISTPFQWLRAAATVFLTGLILLSAEIIVVAARFFPGDSKPVLTMELVPSLAAANPMLHDTDSAEGGRRRAAMDSIQYLDFLFIPCYAGLFFCVSLAIGTTASPPWKWLAWLGIPAILSAAVFDVLEDLRILAVTSGVDTSVRHWGIPKWEAFFAALLLLAAPLVFARRENRLATVAATVGGLAAAIVGGIGLYGGVAGSDSVLTIGANLAPAPLLPLSLWLFVNHRAEAPQSKSAAAG